MDTYAIEADGNGAHQVRVIGPDGDNRTFVMGFRTAGEAQAWVDNQVQIAMKMVTSSEIT